MIYDREVFEKFRAIAVTDANQIEVGKTYYSNCRRGPITVLKILTDKESRIRKELPVDETTDDEKPRWILHGVDTWDTESLWDNNIGASYNPWLLFEREEDMLRCVEEVKISYAVTVEDCGLVFHMKERE